MHAPGNSLSSAIRALGLLTAISGGAYAVLWWFGFGPNGPAPWWLFSDPATADVLISFSEVTVGVLGIAITVVAIIVELAANRYTPRITELFVNDRVNRFVMAFFLLTSVTTVLVNLSLHGQPGRVMIGTSTALMLASLLLILPYFVYVFEFLTPTRIIARLESRTSSAVRMATAGTGLDRLRTDVLVGIEQLGDITLNSIDKKDKPIAIATVNALASVMRTAIQQKVGAPAAWFDPTVLAETDQDFIALHPDMVDAIGRRQTWVEMKVLRQYQTVFGAAANRMRDINHLVGIQTRRLAEEAARANDRASVNQSVRFLNTYMRASLNARDVRTSYNLLNEYRLLAITFLELGETDLVVQVATHIRFYGQLAFAMNTGFILETSAYDLCTLLEEVHIQAPDIHEQVLVDIFLELDREPEGGKTQEQSLRGVRKAQIKLATYYLAAGEEHSARLIFDDMRGEHRERIDSIRAELESVHDQEYWEVSDRGINFEWLPPERRAQLARFFSWFDTPTS